MKKHTIETLAPKWAKRFDEWDDNMTIANEKDKTPELQALMDAMERCLQATVKSNPEEFEAIALETSVLAKDLVLKTEEGLRLFEQALEKAVTEGDLVDFDILFRIENLEGESATFAQLHHGAIHLLSFETEDIQKRWNKV